MMADILRLERLSNRSPGSAHDELHRHSGHQRPRSFDTGMHPIYDRRKEHLCSSDLAIITAGRGLLNLAGEPQQGTEPFPASPR